MREPTWEDEAACAPQNRTKDIEDLDWFSSDATDKYLARAVCQSACTVRRQCIQTALDRKELHGVWGAVDDYELRRAMSVDAEGKPVERGRPPRCPYCLNRKITVSGQKSRKGYRTECGECGLVWHMATVPTKLKGKKIA